MTRGGKLSLVGRCSKLTLASAICVPFGQPAMAWQLSPVQIAQVDPIPQPRRISFSVPLIYDRRVLGDVMLELKPDGEPLFETASLQQQIAPLLNEDGKQRLAEALDGQTFVTSNDLSATQIEIRFDQTRLEIVVDRIKGEYRPTGTLGQALPNRSQLTLPTSEPADFSAYMNFNTNLEYSERDGAQKPEVFIFGAARFQNVVLEVDGALSDQFEGQYKFYRRSVRAVYDQPEQYRRFSAGDLRLSSIPLLRTPFIGGVAVEKSRQIFNPFQPITRLGGREVFLDSRSTVDVLINGGQYQTFELDAGRYDLANLPLQVGSNDVQLRIRDSAGREQTIDLDYFFEPLDLEVGEEEYTAGIGVIARNLSFEPSYSDDPVFTGSYRRGISENLVLGGATQISEALQLIAGEMTIVPQIVPGVFDVQAAVSRGGGTGFAARAGYRIRIGNSFSNRKQFSLTVDYESANYQTVGDIIPSSFNLLTLSASYTQSFTERTYASTGLNHSRRGGGLADRTSAYLDIIHRLNDRLRLTAGIEYGDDDFSNDNFGVRIGISYVFGGDHRVNADYRSRTATTRATVSRGSDNGVGSIGYDLSFSDSQGQTSADASLDYVGNRFQARASVFTDGNNLGNIGDEPRARLQFGTSIAFADGAFGVGRPISDSFAIVKPHPSLKGRNVISGRSLSDNEYSARSGALGAAVQSDLSSYSGQSVQFDVDSLEPGYDIGDGVVYVDPAFHSGYKVIVGNDRYVSALGTLLADGLPVMLVSGKITSEDDEGFEPMPFFTNSIGRFGIVGLAPGKSYQVTVDSLGRMFTITVPAENDGLFRIGELDLNAESE